VKQEVVSLEQRSSEEDVLWVPGLADLLDRILAVGFKFECNVELNGGAVGRVTQFSGM
jgi:hypothetical protein